jgi:hypothetical protein
VIGAGGVFSPPDGYLSAARAVCRETGVLFVADEVITGFGRCGSWFASGRWELEPDILTCAKGITSGYLPMGATIAAPWVAEPFWAEGAGPWRHGYTYSGHAAASAAALANLDILGARPQNDPRARGGPGRGARSGRHPLVEVRAGTGVLPPCSSRQAVAEDRPAGTRGRGLPDVGILASPRQGPCRSPAPDREAELAELAEGIAAGLDAVG